MSPKTLFAQIEEQETEISRSTHTRKKHLCDNNFQAAVEMIADVMRLCLKRLQFPFCSFGFSKHVVFSFAQVIQQSVGSRT